MGDYGSFKRYTDKASFPLHRQVMHLCSCYETAEERLLLQVVQDCTGYSSTLSTSIWLLPWLTGCRLIFWLLAGLSPQVATHMLTACHLDSAEFVLVKVQSA